MSSCNGSFHFQGSTSFTHRQYVQRCRNKYLLRSEEEKKTECLEGGRESFSVFFWQYDTIVRDDEGEEMYCMKRKRNEMKSINF